MNGDFFSSLVFATALLISLALGEEPTRDSLGRAWPRSNNQADKSAAATVSKTKELTKRYGAKRELFRQLAAVSRASGLSFQLSRGHTTAPVCICICICIGGCARGSALPSHGRPLTEGVGTHARTGFGGTVCCDRLRCTKCDLQVLSFDHTAWAPTADYMFFRNWCALHPPPPPTNRVTVGVRVAQCSVDVQELNVELNTSMPPGAPGGGLVPWPSSAGIQ